MTGRPFWPLRIGRLKQRGVRKTLDDLMGVIMEPENETEPDENAHAPATCGPVNVDANGSEVVEHG